MLETLFDDLRWTGVRFYVKKGTEDPAGAVAALRKEMVSRFGDTLEMISGKELRYTILRIFEETFAVTTVLLLIALAVATLGITTTLTVRVLERTRELNTIAAVGGSRRQIRSMILWEALLMVLAGELAGLCCGFILSWLLVYVINRQSFGWTFIYSVDWAALSMSIPLVVSTALFAAVPAVRAVFRKSPATVLGER